MFNNLIESSSHAREIKRRGSFFLYAILAYSLLFVGGGVASIYAYDARLDEQEAAVVVNILPQLVDRETPKPIRENLAVRTTCETSTHKDSDERRQPMANTDLPLAPTKVSAQPNPYLPVRPHESFKESTRDADFGGEAGSRFGATTGTTNRTAPIAVDIGTAPSAPVKRQMPQTIKVNEGLNRKALLLPKPAYPSMAIQIHLGGTVSVQVLIDETGRVVSAHAVSGHPFLVAAAVSAAYQARFSPTTISDVPVKVSGIINYNFVLQ